MKKILIVDDEQVMLQVMERILSEHYEVVCSSSGAQALETFDREKPDIVLSDLRMPGMDGYELRCRLREKSDVPFIFMTSDESDESERRGFDIGAADYIRKPANAAVVLRRIGNIVKNVEKIHGLKEAASLDAMTGLLNKNGAQQTIGKLCQCESGVLLLIDLDSFKLVNDIYGHAMGDRILIRFAQLLRDIAEDGGTPGRLGGDEFIAYLQYDAGEEAVRRKVDYLNEELTASAKEYMGESMGIPLGASVGAVYVPAEGRDFDRLCKKADEALYSVKQQGKHGIAFYGGHRTVISGDMGEDPLSKMRRILDERNPEEGAMLLDFNRFQCVYRFELRQGKSGGQRTWLLCFTLTGENHPERSESFLDTLRTLLKRGDCVMQNGSSQFFALLTDAGEHEAGWIRERMGDLWKDQGSGFLCDMESLVP